VLQPRWSSDENGALRIPPQLGYELRVSDDAAAAAVLELGHARAHGHHEVSASALGLALRLETREALPDETERGRAGRVVVRRPRAVTIAN